MKETKYGDVVTYLTRLLYSYSEYSYTEISKMHWPLTSQMFSFVFHVPFFFLPPQISDYRSFELTLDVPALNVFFLVFMR